ncbi:TPA: hypothetical protein ACT19U_005552 [Raoultella ornithinolytica]
MTKSTITREQLLEIIETDHVQCGEASYLARMALAAMDGEPVAYMTYKGYLLHAGDPKLAEYSEPMPLYADPRPEPISAEPVAWLLSGGGAKNVVVFDGGNAYADPLREVTPLYRHAQPAPVVPDGYVMVPMRLTAENGAKGALSGEFSETKFVNCPECFGDDECETCDGSGRIEITVPVTWTTIKDIWAKGVEHFAAAPQEVKGE